MGAGCFSAQSRPLLPHRSWESIIPPYPFQRLSGVWFIFSSGETLRHAEIECCWLILFFGCACSFDRATRTAHTDRHRHSHTPTSTPFTHFAEQAHPQVEKPLGCCNFLLADTFRHKLHDITLRFPGYKCASSPSTASLHLTPAYCTYLTCRL